MWIGMYKNKGLPEYHWDDKKQSSDERGFAPEEMMWYNGMQEWKEEPIEAVGWYLSTNPRVTNTIQSAWLTGEYGVICSKCISRKTDAM